ncbi:homoserine kinase [Thermithiobacillus plumbiphilus]|uniref:Homoserine kinase n=1 Tax=Thermithiobacillus plumbiphilus TaxID=1729899 RepID=A0ABU9D7L8_9PROT
MSVYTAVSAEALENFLGRYDIGQAQSLRGISAGVENSNFFLDTSEGEFVLTIFERLAATEIPYFLELTAHLAHHGIPCPQPIADREGHYLQSLCGKPAAIVQKLSGKSVELPNPGQTRAVGALLGRMHKAAEGFPLRRENPRGLRWWIEASGQLSSHLSPMDARLLSDELQFQQNHCKSHLPHGVIHADLFRDNALFEGNLLTGVIDFYYAADDAYLYDLAITLNAWCSQPDGALDAELAHCLWEAYQRERPLSNDEIACWPAALRGAALRFWLSRLHDFHFPRPGDLTHTKDPEEYRRILVARREMAEWTDFPGAEGLRAALK